MRCVNCSGQFVTIRGDLEIRDKILGNFIVPDTEYEECEMCGEKLYSPVTIRDIEKEEDLIKKKLLIRRSLEEFILAAEAAQILGCSRQAVHKHKRIRRGFIHFVIHNDKIYYLKKSVEQYKKTGDGRIQLSAPEPKQTSNIIDFAKYYKEKPNKKETKCFMDAGSDSPCLPEENQSQNDIVKMTP